VTNYTLVCPGWMCVSGGTSWDK